MLTSARGAGARILASLCSLLASIQAQGGDSIQRYGAGTAGSGNIAPGLWVNVSPRPGESGFKLQIARSLGGTWAFPFFATAPADFTYGGVRFLIDPARAVYGGAYFMAGAGPGGGAGEVPWPLPNNPRIVGLALHVQAFTLDDLAPNPLGFGATAGLRLTPALPARLVVMQTLPGGPDPQTTIDLGGNRTYPFDVSRFVDGKSVVFAQSGRIAVALDGGAARLRVFDATTWPPSWQRDVTLAAEGAAQRLARTPEGSRVYVLHTGSPGTRPPLAAFDVRAGATFGLAWPGSPIRLDGVHDAQAMVFATDSRRAFVAALGNGIATPGSVSEVDVQPGSPTFHQQVRRVTFAGRQVADLAIAADGTTLYVALVAASRTAELALLDAATLTPIDQDAGTPGVQHLGGEVSLPRTPLPDVLGRLAVDPRGEVVYGASLGAVVQVDVARESATFRRVRTTRDNIPPGAAIPALAVSDAGDRLYAATSIRVVELDTATFLSPRAWSVNGSVGLAFR